MMLLAVRSLFKAYGAINVLNDVSFVVNKGDRVGIIGYGLFRLEDMHKTLGQLSVGQRRKLEIARLMAQGPNVLLLDEPTNYISLDVLEAFESAIIRFPGPVMAISHDRWFMQRFGGQVWELSNGKLVRQDDTALLSGGQELFDR